MAEPGLVAEFGGQPGMGRVAKVEDERLPGREAIGKELTVRRH